MSAVNVLTPNGRRQNVKVQPNTALLQVLEEVCQKHGFISNEYDLKHHKRILDLTLTYRFTGLPNNAQLEMVEAQKKRQEQDVGLVVQLINGVRVEGTFKPAANLANILQDICADECANTDLVVIYMRTEITHDKLGETTLKDLGLVSGRAILRLIHRDPTAAKTQANVSSMLPVKAPPKTEEEKNEPKKMKAEEAASSSTSGNLLSCKKPTNTDTSNDPVEPMENIEPVPTSTQMEVDEYQPAPSSTGSEITIVEAVPSSSSQSSCESSKNPVIAEPDEDVGEVFILGERNAVLFSLETSKLIICDDLPDSFFDLNVNDLKGLIRELRSESMGTSDQPLLTAQMRELEENKKQLNRLNRYKKSIIRIQFPNRYVLQGTFTPLETIETVMNFVRSFILMPDLDFHLFTTPPKTILLKESRLFEVNCVPSAVLHFGTNVKCETILRDDVMLKVSSPKASLILALKEREMVNYNTTVSPMDSSSTSSSSNAATVSKPKANAFISNSPGLPSNNDKKLPKWFKSAGN